VTSESRITFSLIGGVAIVTNVVIYATLRALAPV
jgi:hypothetical protein